MTNTFRNQDLNNLYKLIHTKSTRHAQQKIVIQSEKVLNEITAQVHLLVTDQEQPTCFKDRAEKYIQVPTHIMQKLTKQQNTTSVIAVVDMPSMPLPLNLDRWVILDRIQDPGNLGTIARTAHAFGFCGLFCIDGTCDIYNDKALRAARSAPFFMDIFYGSEDMLIETLKETNLMIADLQGTSIADVVLPSHFAIAIGNEGNGVSEVLKEKGTAITIPTVNSSESLNASIATGIILYTARSIN